MVETDMIEPKGKDLAFDSLLKALVIWLKGRRIYWRSSSNITGMRVSSESSFLGRLLGLPTSTFTIPHCLTHTLRVGLPGLRCPHFCPEEPMRRVARMIS